MEKVICAIVRKYGKMMDYWMTETKWGFKRAGVALMIPFIIGVIIIEFNKEIAVKIALFSMVIFGLLWLLMYLDSGTKFVGFISRGKYDNPRQLLQTPGHLYFFHSTAEQRNNFVIVVSFGYIIE